MRGGAGDAPRVSRVGSVLSYRRRRYRLRRHPEAARLPPRPWLRGDSVAVSLTKAADTGMTGKHTKSVLHFTTTSDCLPYQSYTKTRANRRFPRPRAGESVSSLTRSATKCHSPLRAAPTAPHDRESEFLPRAQSTATPRSPTARKNAHDSRSRRRSHRSRPAPVSSRQRRSVRCSPLARALRTRARRVSPFRVELEVPHDARVP